MVCHSVLSNTLLACLGFLSPSCKVLLITVLVLNVFLGMVAGFVSFSACLCKRTGVSQWKNNVLIIVFFYLGIVFGILFDLKLVLWSYLSAAAILFIKLLVLLLKSISLP